jgi:hypothetical protein
VAARTGATDMGAQAPADELAVQVEIPAGVACGDAVEVVTAGGVVVEFVVPDGVLPGTIVSVEVPRQAHDEVVRASEPACASDRTPSALDPQPTLYSDLLSTSAAAASAAEATDKKNAAKMRDWAAAKLVAYDSEEGVRAKRAAQHGSRAGYASFLSHRGHQHMVEARRAKSSLNHTAGLQLPADVELHEVPGYGRVLIAARSFARHDLLFREAPVVVQPVDGTATERAQLWAQQVRALGQLPDVQQAVLELPQAETLPASSPFRDCLNELSKLLPGVAWDALPRIFAARSCPAGRRGALLAVAGHVPHSCDSNVVVSEVAGDSLQFEVRALSSIRRGEMLTADYFAQPKFVGTAQRRAELLSSRKLRCRCTRCSRDDIVSALPCPNCSPAAEDGHTKLNEPSAGYIRRRCDGCSICDTCRSVFVPSDIERLLRWEQQAGVLVSCMATEVKAKPDKAFAERLRGLHLTTLKLVGRKHWLVYVVQLMQLRAVMGKQDVRASEIASLLSNIFQWLEEVELDPVRYIGLGSVISAARSLRKSVAPLPMAAIEYYNAALEATPLDSASYLELLQALDECHTEIEDQRAKVLPSDQQDQKMSSWDEMGRDAPDEDPHESAAAVRSDAEDLGKHALQQARQSGILDYIQRCFRQCSNSTELELMHEKLQQAVQVADVANVEVAGFWNDKETVKFTWSCVRLLAVAHAMC